MNNDILLQIYRQTQKTAAQMIYHSTCHFLRINEKGRLQPHASGVFVKLDNNCFLFTAGHVVDNCEEDVYIGVKPREPLLKLGGTWVKNVPKTEREKDKVDAAILKLDECTVNKIGDNYQFINIGDIDINHHSKKMPMYLSLGFPASMSKYNSYKNELKSRPFSYITMCADDEIYVTLGCNPKVNLIVHYDKMNVMDYSSGEKKTGPDPFGISGSGLWYIPATEVLKTSGINKKLVAIMTEWPTSDRQYWIGTRIDVFTEIIRNRFGLDIPKSELINVNLE